MDRLVDYIRWVGSLDFECYPFREADALVLCTIAYYDLGPVFEKEGTVLVRDCIPMIEAGQAELHITGGDMGNGEIFEAAVHSRRFGSLIMRDYEDVLREEPALQFSAVTFQDGERFSFIAYRGTDETLTGWKEDFMISFTLTEAQRMAAEYAERQIAAGGAETWYIGGHSKGGNQALYAACMLSDESLSRVTRIFQLDGPGFCPEVLDMDLIRRADPKVTRIIPEFDVIGRFFESAITDTHIVKSSREGIEQHSLATWLVDHGDLASAKRTDPLSDWLHETLDSWINEISQEERPVFINEFFEAMAAGGVQNMDDLDFDAIYDALVSLAGKSDTTKRTLSELPKRAIFDDVLDDARTKNVWELLKTNRLVQGVALILCGVAVLLASENVLDIVSMTLVISLALLQTGLTLRRLAKNEWRLEGMRERIILSIVLITLCVVIFVKEQATFLLGSVIFGVLFLIIGSISSEAAAKHRDDAFLRALHIGESVLAFLFGAGFLVIPQSIVHICALAVGAIGILDGLLRILYLILQKRRRA